MVSALLRHLSWRAAEPELYGRMDLVFGAGPAKLLEYNADTPTALYESAAFQWIWLEEMAAAGALRRDRHGARTSKTRK